MGTSHIEPKPATPVAKSFQTAGNRLSRSTPSRHVLYSLKIYPANSNRDIPSTFVSSRNTLPVSGY